MDSNCRGRLLVGWKPGGTLKGEDDGYKKNIYIKMKLSLLRYKTKIPSHNLSSCTTKQSHVEFKIHKSYFEATDLSFSFVA